MVEFHSSFSTSASRRSIVRTSSTLRSAYRNVCLRLSFSRLGITWTSSALRSAYRKRSFSCSISRLGNSS